MKKQTKRIFACASALAISLAGVTAISTAATGVVAVDDTNRSALLGISDPESYYFGVASQFSVFLREDFAAEESDCEGRLAVGGNANIGTFLNYSVGAKFTGSSDAAHVVVGGDTLTQFSPGTNNFVVGTALNVDDAILNGTGCSVYEGQLFDFDEAFALLEERSAELAQMESNAQLTINPYYDRGWTVTGTDEHLNILTLEGDQLAAWQAATTGAYTYIELVVQIPKDSYLVINVPGESVTMPSTNVKILTPDGTPHGGEGELQYNALLFNLPEAESFHYSGSIQGSTLAPFADVTGNNGGHVSGATIANSFTGGIEFGYSMFNPTVVEIEETTTTAETTTTTAETTTTTTEATTTTAESTTTTTTTSATTAESTTTTTTTTTAVSTTESTTATTTTAATTESTTITTTTAASTTESTTTTTTTTTEPTTTTTTTTSAATTESTTTTTTTTTAASTAESTTTTTTTATAATTESTTAAATTTADTTESAVTTTTSDTSVMLDESVTTTTETQLMDELQTTSVSQSFLDQDVVTTMEESQTETTTTTTSSNLTGSTDVSNPNTADRMIALPLLGVAITGGLALALKRKNS